MKRAGASGADLSFCGSPSYGVFFCRLASGVSVSAYNIPRSLAAIGAFLMIFAVAIDPLSQQLVSYRDESFTDDSLSAKIGVARQWNEAYSLPGTFETPGLGMQIPQRLLCVLLTSSRC